MIQTSNVITLMPVANGWLLTLPPVYRRPGMNEMEERIINLGIKMQEAQMKDPLLQKLQGNEKEPIQTAPRNPTYHECIVDRNSYIFPGIREAFDFIEKMLNNPPPIQEDSGAGYGPALSI